MSAYQVGMFYQIVIITLPRLQGKQDPCYFEIKNAFVLIICIRWRMTGMFREQKQQTTLFFHNYIL